MPDVPLILTLALNAEAEDFFNALRMKYFPPERNYLSAHVTLFHHLPRHVQQEVAELSATQHTFPITVTGVRSLGRGVAYNLESAVLQQLHKHLQQRWQPWLIPQDRQTVRPHITVQNKVTPAAAQQLLHELQRTFTPFEISGLGLRLWNYRGGPWELVHEHLFQTPI